MATNIPKKKPKAMLEYEKGLYGLTEAQVMEKKIVSTFSVHRREGKWQIKVVQSVIDPNLGREKFP
jgi:hypothetical protein